MMTAKAAKITIKREKFCQYMAAAAVGGAFIMGLVWLVNTPKPAPPEPRVWIEFETVQHGLDAAGTLGGSARGLTVCTNAPITERIWVPPHVALSSDPDTCRFKKPPAPNQLVINRGAVISHNVFYYGSSSTVRSQAFCRDGEQHPDCVYLRIAEGWAR